MNPLLQHLDRIDGPTSEEAERIRRRLSMRRPHVSSILIPTGLAVAAAAALLLGALPSATPPAAQPAPVSAALAQPGTVDLTPAVQLEIDGQGSASGDASDLDIAWKVGTLSVSVAPQHGVALTVNTEEANVSVVGTVFTVARGPLGTDISVTEGVVSVECVDMTRHRLGVGDTLRCLPRSAMRRVLTLRDQGAPTDVVLAELSRGLLLDSVKSIRGELLSLKIEVLLEQGSRPAAAAVAWQYLHEGHTARADHLSSLAQEAHP
ncbi:MAG: FecR domain-containing protein [Myxococcota bacterium]|nr:FecR domain-containing protein [Myxococcota bacterium]